MKTADFAMTIAADAKKQVAKIEREAKEEFAKVDAETERLVAQRRGQLEAHVRAQEERERHRLEAKHHLEATIAQLSCKQEALDETFHKAAAQLEKLSGKEREHVLEKLFASASKHVHIGGSRVASQDATFLRSKAVINGTIPSIGGFIAQSEDGKVLVDMRFETVLDAIKQQKMKEIAHILFGEQAA